MRQGHPLSPFLPAMERKRTQAEHHLTHTKVVFQQWPRTVPSPKGAGTMMLWPKCLWEKWHVTCGQGGRALKMLPFRGDGNQQHRCGAWRTQWTTKKHTWKRLNKEVLQGYVPSRYSDQETGRGPCREMTGGGQGGYCQCHSLTWTYVSFLCDESELLPVPSCTCHIP